MNTADGYERAIAVLHGVANRTGSEAARWAAVYLAADPDGWRQAERCWHSEDCPGSGAECAPVPTTADEWSDESDLQETYPGSGIYE